MHQPVICGTLFMKYIKSLRFQGLISIVVSLKWKILRYRRSDKILKIYEGFRFHLEVNAD